MKKLYLLSGFLLVLLLAGLLVEDTAMVADFSAKRLPPSFSHLFGTDQYGRDVLCRTLSGLSKSLLIGAGASLLSGLVSLVLGVVAGIAPKWVDDAIGFVIDAVMSVPHLVTLVLISFCLGGGLLGVVTGIVCTHWTSLARVIRGEVLQLKAQGYVQIATKMGQSPWSIATKHIFPHILPQFVVGVVIMFPHAILHESAVTFLGFGLPPESPTMGILLSESMGFVLSDLWWLFLPGVCLVLVVLAFDALGHTLQHQYSPKEAL